MIETEQKQIEEIYEIDNRKYTVITKSINNAQNIDKLYDILAEFVLSKIN